MKAHYDFCIFFGRRPKSKANERPFSNQLCRRLSKLSLATHKQHHKKKRAALVLPRTSVAKNAEKYDDATTGGGKPIVTPAQSPRTVSLR